MYFIYNTTTGALLTALAPNTFFNYQLPAGHSFKLVGDIPMGVPWTWDSATLMPVFPKTKRTLSKLEFTRRFTMTENVALNAVRMDPATSLTVRAQLETLRDYLNRATDINLDDPDTIAGVEAAVDVLIGAGVVLSENRASRIAAVLEYAPVA